MKGVQHAAAEFGGEEAAEAGLDFDVDGEAIVVDRGRLAGAGKTLLRSCCKVIEPMRHVQRRIAPAARAQQFRGAGIDRQEELRIERAGMGECLGRWRVAIGIGRGLGCQGLVPIDLRPIGIAGRGRQVRGGDEWEDAARRIKRIPQGKALRVRTEAAAIDRRIGLRIVEGAAPATIPVSVFLPVPARLKARIGIAAAAIGGGAAAAAAIGQRLHQVAAGRAAEAEGASIGGGMHRTSRRQQALRAAEDAVPHGVGAVVAHQIGVAVAREDAGAFAERHQSPADTAFDRQFEFADRGLVVGQALVLGGEFRRQVDRLARRDGIGDHLRVGALGVQIDLDPAACARDAVEHRLPEIVAAFGDAALAMDAQRDGGDRRHRREKRGQRIAAIGSMGLRRQPFDSVAGARAVLPLIAMHPDAELEIEPRRHGLLANEAQHREIGVALGIGKVRRAHVVTGHGEQERIEEQEIGIRDILELVVAEPEGEVQAVEALRCQHGEIARPHCAVVEPRLVVGLAGELAHHAAHRIGGPLDDRLENPLAMAQAIGQFAQRIGKPARVGADRQNGWAPRQAGSQESQGLGCFGQRDQAGRHARTHRHEAEFACGHFGDGAAVADRLAGSGEDLFQRLCGEPHGKGAGERIGVVAYQRNALLARGQLIRHERGQRCRRTGQESAPVQISAPAHRSPRGDGFVPKTLPKMRRETPAGKGRAPTLCLRPFRGICYSVKPESRPPGSSRKSTA